MIRLLFVLCTALLFSSATFAKRIERLFYLTPDGINSSFTQEQLQQLSVHKNKIDIIAPQIYQLDAAGVITGKIDPKLLTLAKANKQKIMPLIVNPNFNQQQIHDFLQNPFAQARAISQMILLCQKYYFYGIQFDIENIHINDKTKFTKFFVAAASKLHQNGFAISIAVVPHSSEIISNEYDRWLFENWTGAYDLRKIANSADFISIMSYDQHTNLTTPGPLAAANWVEKIIQHTLKEVPANKISLGIPCYSIYYSTGKLAKEGISEQYTFRSKAKHMSYTTAITLLNEFKQSLTWHKQWQSPYVMFENNGKNEFLFLENAKSFKAKQNLAKRYHLQGISVWKLGLEDPAIWGRA